MLFDPSTLGFKHKIHLCACFEGSNLDFPWLNYVMTEEWVTYFTNKNLDKITIYSNF